MPRAGGPAHRGLFSPRSESGSHTVPARGLFRPAARGKHPAEEALVGERRRGAPVRSDPFLQTFPELLSLVAVCA